MRNVVTTEALLEEKVVRQRDALVDGEPVADEVHEVLEDFFEVRVARDRDGDVDDGGDESQYEPRHPARPASEDLDGQADGVDVGAVVGDDG